jgi:hypothetical protein
VDAVTDGGSFLRSRKKLLRSWRCSAHNIAEVRKAIGLGSARLNVEPPWRSILGGQILSGKQLLVPESST